MEGMFMNTNFNKIIQKSIPYAFIILIAYIIGTVIFVFLPKSGVDFIRKDNESLAYKKYDGFYLRDIKQEKNKQKDIDRKSLSDYLLKGIYSTSSNSGWIIVQDNNKNKSYILSQYEKLDDYVLSKLFKNFVIFEKAGKEFTLEMKKNNEKNVGFKMTADVGGIEENVVVDSSGVKVKRSYLNTYVQDIDKVWNNIAISEIRKNGKIDGFKVLRVNQDSVFKKLGLKKGDVIKSVNNSVLSSYSDAFRVYNNINNIKYLNIEILRNNEVMELNYEID